MAVTLASKVVQAGFSPQRCAASSSRLVVSLESDLDAVLADSVMWRMWTRQLRDAHEYFDLVGGRMVHPDILNPSHGTADRPHDGWAVLAACDSKLDVLFAIRSSPEDWLRRAAFRKAMSEAGVWDGLAKAAVFLTNPPNTTANGSSANRLWLRLEAKHFGDIHVVLVDDDLRVDFGLLIQYLKEHAAEEASADLTIHCNVGEAAVAIEDRENVSSLVIHHESPTATARSQHRHCTGHAMITTPSALRALLEEHRLWEENAVKGDRNVSEILAVQANVTLVDVRAPRKDIGERRAPISRYGGMFTSENAYFTNPFFRSLVRVAPWPFGPRMSCWRKILTHLLARNTADEDDYDNVHSFNLLRVLYFFMGIGI
ncbi:hypothetical protein HPB48_019137 [Haemaphysalis longicornis]|uniref:Uncharacterized protein n=1 Tax=Haemaphysalis longicornis TaxID=44386 RepID=A0A9J6G9C1_HAELO|nr:hypothetical protein HPB48_019137 [Haemaphysalis longicornis]